LRLGVEACGFLMLVFSACPCGRPASECGSHWTQSLTFEDGISAPGKYVQMKAEMDVIVLISNCPQLNPAMAGIRRRRRWVCGDSAFVGQGKRPPSDRCDCSARSVAEIKKATSVR
jgi:hypothetical protein